MELVDPFGWSSLERRKIIEIREKLGHFEARTWHEILIESKKQNHSVPISDLSSDARQRLQDLQLDDVDSLISLRLAGKQRIWGILDNAVLQVLWWDPEHQVCPAPKKHT